MIQGAAFRILTCFYDNDSGNFADLCERAGYPTDLGGYYLRQLVKAGYLEKTDRGVYHLLPKGKQELALHYGKKWFGLRPRFNIVIIARQAESVVVLRRKVQPFIGVAEWPAGMVQAGETVPAAAKRVLSRLGAEAPLELVGFFRRIDMYEDAIFDDKLFAVHTTELSADHRLTPTNINMGDNMLHNASDLHNIENPSRALLDIYEFVQAGGGQLTERTYHLTVADLSLHEEQ